MNPGSDLESQYGNRKQSPQSIRSKHVDLSSGSKFVFFKYGFIFLIEETSLFGHLLRFGYENCEINKNNDTYS